MLCQPIFNLKTNRILGYEALARVGNKPFFPDALLRRTANEGQVVDFDLACFKIAFSILPELRSEQILFVNVEPLTLTTHFRRGEDIDRLLRTIKPYCRRLVFELTEGMKARDFRYLKKGVAFLRRKGSCFALDDIVGIGSKLFDLATLKPEYIKIGRELVDGVSHNSLHQTLIHRIIDVARKSRSALIAEGVEKKKDLHWLSNHGIVYAQGYYLSRPYSLTSREGTKSRH